MGSLCFISCNCIWIYSFLKIKSLKRGEGGGGGEGTRGEGGEGGEGRGPASLSHGPVIQESQ